MSSRIRIVLALFFVASSCAYGYAGQEGKRRTEKENNPSVKVVEIKEGPADDEKEPEPEPKPESPCGATTFHIFYYTDSTQVTKTVDCMQRAVVDIQRTPIGETTYVDARAAGLPESSWYLVVDPKGIRANFLNNAQLLKLSREFSIEYYGRDSSRDLLVYLYQQEDVQ